MYNICWKNNCSLTPHVPRSLFGWMVCFNFLKGWEVTLQCSYRTFFIIIKTWIQISIDARTPISLLPQSPYHTPPPDPFPPTVILEDPAFFGCTRNKLDITCSAFVPVGYKA